MSMSIEEAERLSGHTVPLNEENAKLMMAHPAYRDVTGRGDPLRVLVDAFFKKAYGGKQVDLNGYSARTNK